MTIDRRRRVIAAVLALVPASSNWAQDSESYSGNEAKRDQFASGFAAAPVRTSGPGFLGAAYDWTGFGWQQDATWQGLALGSDTCAVSARHSSPGVVADAAVLSSIGWAGYDPAPDVDFDQAAAPVAARDDVRGVGFHVESDAMSDKQAIWASEFHANLEIVPAPATLSLLGVSLVLIARRRCDVAPPRSE